MEKKVNTNMSWSEIVKMQAAKFLENSVKVDDMPDVSKTDKLVNDVTLECGNLNINDASRAEITELRRNRRKLLKQAKDVEEQKNKMRSQDQQLHIISNTFLQRYNEKLDTPNSAPSTSVTNKDNTKMTLGDYLRSNKEEVRDQYAKQLASVAKQSRQILLKRKKKKCHEHGSVKRYSLLKKNILKIRQLKKSLNHISELELPNSSDEENVLELEISDVPLIISQNIKSEVQPSLVQSLIYKEHSRKFRPYCDNMLSPELCKNAEILLDNLFQYQRRAHLENPNKGIMNLRYVVGFREVKKYIECNKIKLVLIAPDLEKIEGPKGLDELVDSLKALCVQKNQLYAFALKKRFIGYLLHKKAYISCVGIINYKGMDDTFNSIKENIIEARKEYTLTMRTGSS